MTNDKGAQLRRDIGFFGAAFLVLNAMIGAGIFALPGKVAVNAGMLSPWLFLAVGVVFLAVVLTFAELASYFRESGGPVLYASYAFGPLAGFGTGWILFLSRMTAFAANANVMAIYLGSLFPWFAEGVGRTAVISIVTLGLTYANILGVKDGHHGLFHGAQGAAVSTARPAGPAARDYGHTDSIGFGSHR
jgi:amino acid transporter